MKIQSGDTANYIYFVAVDSTDLKTRETGLSSFTVYRSRNGGAASAMTTPTINEVDATNLPGVYELLIDEDTTATENFEEMVFHITQASMAPVTRTIEIHRLTASNVTEISSDSTAADNLELQYDGTGLSGDTFPSSQAQIGNISSGAGGLSIDAESFTLTTGTQSSGTVADTEELDGVLHTITPSASVIDCYYQFDVGTNGAATEALWDGYVGNNSDSVEVFGYDWVSTSYKQIGTISGKNANTNEEHAYILTSAMTGTGANIGKVRVKFSSDGGDVAVDLNTDRILCEYTSVAADRLILHTGLAQAGTTNTVTLDSGASATDNYYKHARILVAGGTGSEQERIVVDYVGSTKVATIAPPWVTQPDTTSVLEVLPGSCHAETNSKTVKVGLAQAGTSSTITLSADASSIDDYYNDDLVEIDYGTGEGQARIITDYNGTTKVATVFPNWITTPDTTSEYLVEEALTVVGKMETDTLTADALATDAAEEVADTVWDEQITTSAHNGAQSAGKRLRQASGSLAVEAAVNDASATTTSFVTDLSSSVDDFYNDSTLTFLDGALSGQSRVITDYNGTTKTVTFDEALTSAPADTVTFQIAADHIHAISQIQSGLATSSALSSLDTKVGTPSDTSIAQDIANDSAMLDTLATSSALATVDSNVDAILVDTGTTLPASIAGLNDLSAAQVNAECDTAISDASLATASSLATVDSNVDAILVDTGTTIPAQITALNDISVSDVLTTQMTEAYAADGATPTLTESLMLIQQVLTDFGIAGTTLTVRKVDGSTTAGTFTLNDGTTPTDVTRAS